MSEPVILLLSALAVFRATELATTDLGPWHIFERLRKCSDHPTWCELVSCPYCCGMHLSWLLAVALACLKLVPWILVPLWWLAIAGGAVVILRVVGHRN